MAYFSDYQGLPRPFSELLSEIIVLKGFLNCHCWQQRNECLREINEFDISDLPMYYTILVVRSYLIYLVNEISMSLKYYYLLISLHVNYNC